ncbi:MAG: T9SS type A sorting domain-containing protein [Clostridia bacterium]|nr:T9SS type A sorting domain-containing protein [Clostridia bacterium]
MNFQKFTRYTLLTVLALFLLTGLRAQEQKIAYTDSWQKAGYTLLNANRSNVQVNFSIREFTIADTRINGAPMQNIILDGVMLPNDEGAPNLPGTSRYIAVPEGARPVLKITDYRTELIKNVEVAPSPRIPLETEKGELEYHKGAIYSQNAFYPKNPIQISEVTEIRGVDAVMLGITPFQYNPVTKELLVYRDVEVEITFEGGRGEFGDNRLRSRWWDPIMKDVFFNYASLPQVDYNQQHQQAKKNRDEGFEYLIVVPNNPEFMQWADSIKEFRQKQGILTGIVTLADIGTNSTTGLETYFNNIYNTWTIPPAAILLLADYGTNAANTITSPIWDNYCASDNIFADVNNNDMPDIIFARITANNAQQLQVMVTKFIHYEKNPPIDPDFYHKPITALGWQTERWFQLCSEVVGGFWRKQGKDPVRVNAIYQGTPGNVWSSTTYGNTTAVVNYFGPNGEEYIPQTPAELGGWSGGTAAMVNTAINNGAFMLQHRDHGFEQGWGEPDYTSSNIPSLHNTDLCFVFSINCLTGKYNMSGECFTEKFHRYTYNGQNSGALGLIAASEVSYSFVNDVYVWGMFDNMYPEFMPDQGGPVEERDLLPSFANAAGKYFLQQSAWPYNTNNKEVTYNLFHHHGGAFLQVYSEVPQDLTVMHNPVLISGESSFTVTAEEGAFIALTVNGEIIGTAEATGAPVSISIEPQLPANIMLVTITKQNYYRYEQGVEIIPPAGPYIVYNEMQIDDASGNADAMLDFSENVLLDVTLKNVGVENANNVIATLVTDDEFITIIDGEADYGTIGANAIKLLAGAFQIEAAGNIPDNHTVIFTISASNGTDSWVSNFSIKAHAPMLEVLSITVADAGGNNNGFLDPGETADIIFETANSGSSAAMDVNAVLSSMSPFITLNNTTYNLNTLEAGATGTATFNITVLPTTPIGTVVSMVYTVESGMYELEEVVGLKVGLIIEDFETGDFGQYEWEFAGNGNWTITNVSPYEGTYSAKSGTISSNQSTSLKVTMDVMNDDEISFYHKVSSEGSYDFLRFLIDGTEKGSWSGTTQWAQATYNVSAGEHTFEWKYQKDQSVNGGSDCGWIDYITFPAAMNDALVVFAGADDQICEGNTYSLNATALNYETIVWQTSGSGTFDDITTLNPTYTPSADDIAAGQVTLTVTIYGNSQTMTDSMILGFVPIPGQCAVPEGESALCQNPGTTTYQTEVMNDVDDYMWVLMPESAGTINNTGATATIIWDAAFTGSAQVMVKGNNDCGEGDMSEPLDVVVEPFPAAGLQPAGESELCQGNTATVYTTTTIANADTYMWQLVPGTAGTLNGSNMEITITWNNTWAGDALLSVKGVNECGEGEFSTPLAITLQSGPAAAMQPTGDTDLCQGTPVSVYATDAVAYANTYLWELTPAEAGTISGDQTEIQVTWTDNWTGEAMLSVKGMNACGEGEVSTPLAIMIKAFPGIPTTPQGDTDLCQGTASSTYTTAGATAATEYVWELLPAEAGYITTNGMNAEVAWATDFTGDAMVHLKAMNDCGESMFSQALNIMLATLPGQPQNISGFAEVCKGTMKEYSVADIAESTSTMWKIEPAEAATLTYTGQNCEVSFSDAYMGAASLMVQGVNDCGEGAWSEAFIITINDCTGIGENDESNMSVYPNPANSSFTLRLIGNDLVTLTLMNSIGKTVYTRTGIAINGTTTTTIDASQLAAGIYYLKVEGTEINASQKVIIRK